MGVGERGERERERWWEREREGERKREREGVGRAERRPGLFAE